MKMNFFGGVLALIASLLPFEGSAATVSQGETAVFEFTGLPDLYLFSVGAGCGSSVPCPTPRGGAVTISLAGNLLDAGEQIVLRAYENNLSELPAYSDVFTSPTDQFGFHLIAPPTFWADQQGIFTLTALVGSINLSFVQARHYVLSPEDMIFYARAFDVSPVPIPPAVALFASGFIGLGLLSWRKKHRRTVA